MLKNFLDAAFKPKSRSDPDNFHLKTLACCSNPTIKQPANDSPFASDALPQYIELQQPDNPTGSIDFYITETRASQCPKFLGVYRHKFFIAILKKSNWNWGF